MTETVFHFCRCGLAMYLLPDGETFACEVCDEYDVELSDVSQ